MATKFLQIAKNRWVIATASVVLGAAIILGVRYFTYKVDEVHYHANFALFVNGKREEFKGMQYYTEVEMCTLSKAIQPTQRAHMHDNINDVIHVEDHAVTWGQFFDNLRWVMGPTFISAPDGTIYSENGDNKLHLVLNGQDYTDFGGMQNQAIKDTDKLLVSFGNESSDDLKQQYSAVPGSAKKYDVTKDPASCSGNHGTTMQDRLDHMF